MAEQLIDIDLTYDYLEEQLEDECKCEAWHDRTNTACSVNVTHRLSTCYAPIRNVCLSTVKFALSPGDCGACGKPTADCWSVIPV